MKFLSDHNVNIFMKPVPCPVCKQPEDMFVRMEILIKGKKCVWANVVSNVKRCRRLSISQWFSIAAGEIKRSYELNS